MRTAQTNASPDTVILCGGLGTRLRSVVGDRPKPMAVVAGRPFLVLQMEHLATFGFRRFVLCVGFMAEFVEEYFRDSRLPFEVVIVREDQPLGTGGALRNALPSCRSKTVLVLNGDSFCAMDYAAMVTERHIPGDVGVAVVRATGGTEYGGILLGPGDRIARFAEKDPAVGALHVNAGVYVFGRDVIESLDRRVPLSLEREVFPDLAAQSRLWAREVDGPLLDIGTPERYEQAREELLAMMRESRGRA